jgi:hypothetical protein
MTASVASSTNTSTPPELPGWHSRHLQAGILNRTQQLSLNELLGTLARHNGLAIANT